MRKYGVFSGPHFSVSGLNVEIYSEIYILSANTGKYGPEKSMYLNTFRAVLPVGKFHFELWSEAISIDLALVFIWSIKLIFASKVFFNSVTYDIPKSSDTLTIS